MTIKTLAARPALPVGFFVFLVATLAGALQGSSASPGDPAESDPERNPVGVFHSDSDTLEFYLGETHGQFQLAGVADLDTTRLPAAGPLILMSRVDTLVILPRFEPVDLWMISPRHRILESFLFHLEDSKLDLLRKYPRFGDTQGRELPAFRYAGPENEKLVELRRVCRLDSVAGDGGEIERILNLLEWAHTVVRHDGNSKNPEPREALNLIRICREENRGVNCRMMATILNEALLSMGFRSRFVTCLPFDKEDPDCHVTVLVYPETLAKWIYLDPTFGAYFKDGQGGLLSHEEVREGLISGAPLKLPESMDWNGQPKDHWEYLRYMAKNLFRFNCALESEPGYESRAEGRSWVALNPAGYDSLKIGTADSTASGVTYFTDDAAFFWAGPSAGD